MSARTCTEPSPRGVGLLQRLLLKTSLVLTYLARDSIHNPNLIFPSCLRRAMTAADVKPSDYNAFEVLQTPVQVKRSHSDRQIWPVSGGRSLSLVKGLRTCPLLCSSNLQFRSWPSFSTTISPSSFSFAALAARIVVGI